MRKQYDIELDNLKNELIEMGAAVEKAIHDSLVALQTRDHRLARTIIDNDDVIDEMESIIEKKCLKMLLKQQPVASDLRFISSTLKIITDLERIGDHAEDISEISMSMGDQPLNNELKIIKKMYDTVSFMIKTTIDSFISRDESLARTVVETDDIVDDLLEELREKSVWLIQEGMDSGDEIIDLMQIGKYLERVGDHSVNTAEWVIFYLTGHHKNYTLD